jgi:hypothetical protein
MNDQVQNIDNTTPSTPVSVIVFDKEGNPLPVKPISPTEVQDIEYSEDPKGN